MTKRNLTDGRSMKTRPLLRNPERKYITERAKYETRLLALHTHASQLNSAEEIDTIAKYTLDALELTLGFEHADFLLVENDSLQIKESRGRPVAFSAQPLGGRGVTVKAANTKTTLRISDTRKEPAYVDPKGYDWTGPHTILSELAVPVVVDTETVAVLNAESIHLDAFSTEDQRLLEILAVHVGSVLGRLEYEEKLLALHTHAQRLASVTSIEEMVEHTLDAMEFTLGYDSADFSMVEAEKGCLRFKGLRGMNPSFSELPLDGPGVTVKAVNTRRTIRVSDIRKEDAYVDDEGRVGEEGSQIHLSELAVPVIMDDEAVAVLNLESNRLNAFTDNDQSLLETLATHVASCLKRLRQEEALRENEERFRKIFEEGPLGMALVRPDYRLAKVNKAFSTMLGYSEEELTTLKFTDITHPEDTKLSVELTEKLIRGEIPSFSIEKRYIKKNGELVSAKLTSSYIHDTEGNPIYSVGMIEDITEHKRAEEKLRQLEERYHSLFDRMLDGVYLSTHKGRFVDVNSAFVKMFGYSSKQEMLDIKDIKKELYFSPEERGSHILDTGQQEVEVYRMRRKDGSEVWVEDHGGYVHDERGNIIYHEGTLRDVTERKRLQEELKQYSLHLEELVAERTKELGESEEKYRELFDACPVSLWEEDFSAVKQFLYELRQKGVSDFSAHLANHPQDIAKCAGLVKVLNVNKATLKLYNAKSVSEIIGGLSGVLTEESNRKQFSDELVAFAQGKKYYEAEMENRTLLGETKHCDVICAVVPGYEQTLAKVLVCIVDLTPQKKLEAEIVKSQRLAAIGETAAMVGHDLRNPLQGIGGAAYNIRRHLLNALDPSTKEMLAVIDNGVQYANGIINDLLEFSKTMQLHPVPTTPKSIVRNTLTEVKVPNNITIEDTTADAPEILADEPKLRRVLTNLIGNAIDAMPEGGKLSIYSVNTQKEVSISVQDTGFGIPQEMVEKIWTPLHSTKAKGIGLGLPICRRILEAHGGSISVESTVGKGTTFTLKLPIQHVQTGGEPL